MGGISCSNLVTSNSPRTLISVSVARGWMKSQEAVHDQGVDQAECRMAERLWHPADDREAAALPDSNRCLVACHHIVELHGLVPGLPGHIQRVFAEGLSDSLAACLRGYHVSGVGDVIAQSVAGRPEHVATDDHTVFTGEEGAGRWSGPQPASSIECRCRIQGVRVAGGHHGVEYRPHEVEVFGGKIGDVERRHRHQD